MLDREIAVGPISVTVQQLVLVSCLFGSYLFSFIYYWKLLKSKNHHVKHLYVAAVANLFLFACYSLVDVLQVYLYIVFSYSFTRAFRKQRWMPSVHFVVIMVLVSAAHLYRQFAPDASVDRYKVDITGVLMMLAVKLTSFAFDAYDSKAWKKRPLSPITLGGALTTSAGKLPLNEKQSKFPIVDNATKFAVLRKFPSLIEFLAYALLYPGVLTGPTISFFEYRTFIDGSYFSAADFAAKALPGRKRRALYLVASALFFLALHVGLQWKLPVAYVVEEEFMRKSLAYRLAYVHFSNLVARCRYYFAWMVAEGSYVIIGLGYRMSASGKPLWDRLENVNPFRIETNSDFRFFISAWNVCTNQWLNVYVYRRIQNYYGKERSSARATVITNLVSAFWHGFYPGYYLMFVSIAWLTVVSRRTRFILPWLVNLFLAL